MRIDVFHDTACPWCRIGKAHLKQAIAQWTGDPVAVYYHAFFLNPDIPLEGYPFREYMTAKGGGQVPMEGWFDAPRQMGQQAGLTFNFEAIDRAPNTTRSHQLIMLAPPDLQEQVIDAVYAAYFEHGQDIGDLDVLSSIAAACDLDAEMIRAELSADSQQAAVMASAQQGAQIGVRGVPFFIFNQRLAFSGAQPPDVILDVMRQAQTQTEGVQE